MSDTENSSEASAPPAIDPQPAQSQPVTSPPQAEEIQDVPFWPELEVRKEQHEGENKRD